MQKKEKYSFIDSNKVFLWALLLPQIFSIIVASIFSFFYTEKELSSSIIYIIVSALITQIAFFVIAIYYNRKNKIDFLKATRVNFKLNLLNIGLCFLISVVAVFGFVNFINLVDKVLIKIGFELPSISLPLNNIWWLLLNVVLLAILPAILEEIIFRGMIFNGLKKKGFWFACLISSLMFAIEHLSIAQFVFQFIMGIVFCLIYNKTNSLVYTIFSHFCNNFIVLIINYITLNYKPNLLNFNLSNICFCLLAVIIAVVASIIIYIIIKFLIKDKITKNDTYKNKELYLKNETLEDKILDQKWLTIALGCGAVLWLFVVIGSQIV